MIRKIPKNSAGKKLDKINLQQSCRRLFLFLIAESDHFPILEKSSQLYLLRENDPKTIPPTSRNFTNFPDSISLDFIITQDKSKLQI